MPSSVVRTFSDPDDYAAAIRGATAEVTVTGSGNFVAKNTKIELHRLRLQRSSANLPRIYRLDERGDRAIILFRTQAGPSLLHNGREMHSSGIVHFGAGQSHYERSSGSRHPTSLMFPQ